MKNAVLILVLVGLAGLMLLFSEGIVQYLASAPHVQQGPSLGQIVALQGTVEHRPRGEVTYATGTVGQAIGNFMTLRTGPNSTAELALYNHYVIRLEADSEIILEELSATLRQVVLTLRRGHFNVVKAGDTNTLLTVHQDLIDIQAQQQLEPLVIEVQKTLAPQIETSPTPTASLPPPFATPPDPGKLPKKEAPVPEATRSLSNIYINNVISTQSPYFYRCYARYLQKNPTATGELKFSFRISPNGKVENLQLIESTLKDQELTNCAQSVLTRLRFRSYDGKPISVTYPIVFK